MDFPNLSPLAAEVQRPAAHQGVDPRAEPRWHDEGAFLCEWMGVGTVIVWFRFSRGSVISEVAGKRIHLREVIQLRF